MIWKESGKDKYTVHEAGMVGLRTGKVDGARRELRKKVSLGRSIAAPQILTSW